MASKLNDLESLVTCAVCLQRFTQPKLLHCGHTFCLKCLEQLAGIAISVSCPTCRSVTNIPHGGVNNLSDDYKVCVIEEVLEDTDRKKPSFDVCSICKADAAEAHSFCLSCMLSFCGRCEIKHREKGDTDGHTVILSEGMIVCDTHDRPCSHVCYDCKACVCEVCLMDNCVHHARIAYHDAIDAYKDTSQNVDLVSQYFSKMREEQAKRFRATKDKVISHTEDLIGKLFQARDSLVRELDTMEATSLAAIDEEEENHVSTLSLVSSCVTQEPNETIAASLIRKVLSAEIIPQGCLRRVLFTPTENVGVGEVECEIEMRECETLHKLHEEFQEEDECERTLLLNNNSAHSEDEDNLYTIPDVCPSADWSFPHPNEDNNNKPGDNKAQECTQAEPLGEHNAVHNNPSKEIFFEGTGTVFTLEGDEYLEKGLCSVFIVYEDGGTGSVVIEGDGVERSLMSHVVRPWMEVQMQRIQTRPMVVWKTAEGQQDTYLERLALGFECAETAIEFVRNYILVKAQCDDTS